jgi:hypothetical protein
MPLLYRLDDGTVFYDVEKAVGLNSPNQREDVRMVQYMLRGIYGGAVGSNFVDGWIGPVTIGWIRKLQADMNAGGNPCATDGRVDGVLNFATLKGSVSGLYYTIVYLNLALRAMNPVAYAALPTVIRMQTLGSGSVRPNPYNPQQVPATGGL